MPSRVVIFAYRYTVACGLPRTQLPLRGQRWNDCFSETKKQCHQFPVSSRKRKLAGHLKQAATVWTAWASVKLVSCQMFADSRDCLFRLTIFLKRMASVKRFSGFWGKRP